MKAGPSVTTASSPRGTAKGTTSVSFSKNPSPDLISMAATVLSSIPPRRQTSHSTNCPTRHSSPSTVLPWHRSRLNRRNIWIPRANRCFPMVKAFPVSINTRHLLPVPSTSTNFRMASNTCLQALPSSHQLVNFRRNLVVNRATWSAPTQTVARSSTVRQNHGDISRRELRRTWKRWMCIPAPIQLLRWIILWRTQSSSTHARTTMPQCPTPKTHSKISWARRARTANWCRVGTTDLGTDSELR